MVYANSQYKFTDPIRYFKANDPIYYEVDNIPLKQLQENDLWLKDQIQTITNTTNINGGSLGGTIDRSNFSELKPYCGENDNIVKVRPGRFTARINDAYNITPLQFLSRIGGDSVSGYNSWTAKASNDASLSAVINLFKTNVLLASNSLNMNGLVERAFAYPAYIPDKVSSYLASSSPTINPVDGADSVKQPPYPLIQAQLWNAFTYLDNGINYSDFVIRQYDDAAVIGFASLGAAESEFVKRWRGVARTAIVDVASELQIPIEAFNADDFYYIDQNSGQKINLTQAVQRIDLLFIYAKPIDTSSVTINKFNNNQPLTITSPQLGIVKGAGVGVDFRSRLSRFKTLQSATVNSGVNNGFLKMLPSISDQVGDNNGFTISGLNIKGSFPSPDDLMNLTPILDEELTSNHFGLIGQSILPIAYIVVKKAATINENTGINIVTNSDIIDIRPFFRTTELSYNERAGIAAAVPAPSLANPVVTQAELDYELKRTYTTLGNRISTLEGGGTINSPRIIGVGTVKGGLYYGVEGALAKRELEKNTTLGTSDLKDKVKSKYNYKDSIPNLPDWEIARWCSLGTYADKGLYPNDRINFHLFKTSWENTQGRIDNLGLPKYQYGALEVKPTVESDFLSFNKSLRRFGIRPLSDGLTDYPNAPYSYNYPTNLSNNVNGQPYCWLDGMTEIYFVKKTIRLDKGDTASWLSDYDVNVQFLNCAPHTSRASEAAQDGGDTPAGIAGIWVEKFKDGEEDYFTIYVAWHASSYRPYNTVFTKTFGVGLGRIDPPSNREGNHFAGFAVVTKDIMDKDHWHSKVIGESSVGIAIYPTVQFQIVGYPASWNGFATSLNDDNATITLKS